MATIRELIANLRTQAKEIAEAAQAACTALAAHYFLPAASAGVLILSRSVASESGSAGKRYRLTSGHAPIFSLFTFFGLR